MCCKVSELYPGFCFLLSPCNEKNLEKATSALLTREKAKKPAFFLCVGKLGCNLILLHGLIT